MCSFPFTGSPKRIKPLTCRGQAAHTHVLCVLAVGLPQRLAAAALLELLLVATAPARCTARTHKVSALLPCANLITPPP